MSTIVTRAGKGSPLTHNEVDANFTNLNTDKIQSGNTVAALTITSATISGGTITGITDLAIADGGTGASTAANARTNLGVTGTGSDTAYAFRANNLSDLASSSTARTNLGVTATGADTAYAFRANNLSDLASSSTARTNLGLGTAATTSSTDYATAAQGTKADTALQPAAIGTTVQAYDADLTAFAGKTAPSGDVVGTTDTQTLTNKTINASQLVNNSITSAKMANGGAEFGIRNRLINSKGLINQRGYVSGTATSGANQYTVDRWRVVTSGQNLTFSTTANVTTFTAPAGGVEQVIEGLNLESGTYVLSWTGTATATVGGTSVSNGGTISVTGGTNTTVKFSSGTFSVAQFEKGTTATPFDYRSYGTELQLCQRYYERINNVFATCSNGGFSNSYANYLKFNVTKRDVPTITIYSAANLTGTAGSATWFPGTIVAAINTEATTTDTYMFNRLFTSTYILVTYSAIIVSEL